MGVRTWVLNQQKKKLHISVRIQESDFFKLQKIKQTSIMLQVSGYCIESFKHNAVTEHSSGDINVILAVFLPLRLWTYCFVICGCCTPTIRHAGHVSFAECNPSVLCPLFSLQTCRILSFQLRKEMQQTLQLHNSAQCRVWRGLQRAGIQPICRSILPETLRLQCLSANMSPSPLPPPLLPLFPNTPICFQPLCKPFNQRAPLGHHKWHPYCPTLVSTVEYLCYWNVNICEHLAMLLEEKPA